MATWNCTEFESELQQCLDARRPLASLGVSERRIRCGHCRGLWERFLLLEQALADWNRDSANGDLSEAVVARVVLDSELPFNEQFPAAGPRRIAGSSRRRAAVAATTAVVLLVALVPLLRESENRVAEPPSKPDLTVTQQAAPGKTQAGNPAGQRDLQFLLRDAGTAYSALAHQAGAAVADATRLVPANSPPPGTSPNAAFSDVTWVDDWRRDLKPIGDDVHNALSFLFDAVAVDEDTSI